jgi:DNA-binding XRE family transcriptional regulator
MLRLKGKIRAGFSRTRDIDQELLERREQNMLRVLGLLIHLEAATSVTEHIRSEISEVLGCVNLELILINRDLDLRAAMKKRLGSTREETKITLALVSQTRAALEKAYPHRPITQSDIAAELDCRRETISRIEKSNKK